ncbi:anaerobic ribonucleoside-triphosphate reductase activating protein [Parabacteroides sp. AF17-3]|uniref:anaerobic ribonucleoside-triphosphate reductase activating protein n=1 Tax=Parabacteroides sp. AF17-3 TaxID=2293113 RepID=UPI000F007381|nr:anaerobic ribonucleoside-triphosphate reductase activating protein [Parabacteroides sp. AF17-3]RKU69524.1 anaerobic ribonucleoside-triphosphate reductase activating protein [Parabacteroides sp. AF17-3]
MLKYVNTDVTFQEFPDEVALCINISNCPCHCPGCHSSYLVKDIGELLTKDTIDEFMDKYHEEITLIGFMGGDDAPFEVSYFAQYIKERYNIKVGWYSGKQMFPNKSDKTFPFQYFDYIKLGPYIEALGGLKSKNTNQRMFSIKDGVLIDITYRFRNKIL